MQDDEFEWDDPKAEANLRKHGVSFVAAGRIFDDIFSLDWSRWTTDEGEVRYMITGLVGGVLLTAVYTERNGRTRLISARRATNHERQEYYRSKTPG